MKSRLRSKVATGGTGGFGSAAAQSPKSPSPREHFVRLIPSPSTLLMLPALMWLVALVVVPCGLVLTLAFFQRGTYGGIVYEPTLENLKLVFDPLYAGIFLTSAKIAGITTAIAVVIGYAAAYAIASAPRDRQAMLLFFAVLPFWSNYLIRTYAWIVLLNREGLITQALRWFGYEGEPPSLLYTQGAIITGLVYNYLPFVILACYAPIRRLHPELREASRDLGASAATTFRRVTLPLSMPGIVAGGVFVFVLSIGNFITPALLGGGQIQMIGNLVYAQFLTANDWPFGAALSMFLIGIMLALLMAQARLTAQAAKSARDDG